MSRFVRGRATAMLVGAVSTIARLCRARSTVAVGIVLLTAGIGTSLALASTSDDEQRRIVPADQAKARSIVVRRADLSGGWKILGPWESGTTACPPKFVPDFSRYTVTGSERGKQFYRQTSDTDFVLASSVRSCRRRLMLTPSGASGRVPLRSRVYPTTWERQLRSKGLP